MATTVKKAATPAVAKVEKVAKPAGKKASQPAKTAAKPRQAAVKKTEVVENAAPVKLAPPSREQIELLARNYWAERGYQDGLAVQDWLRAEHDLQQKAS
jgi:hypothetical protein